MDKPKSKKKEWSKPFYRDRPKDDLNTRTKVLSLRLSRAEYAILDTKSKACGMKISTYVRRCVLDKTPRAAMTKEELDLYKDVKNVLVDCRQMSNYFHKAAEAADPRNKSFYDKKTWTELQNVIVKLKKVLKI